MGYAVNIVYCYQLFTYKKFFMMFKFGIYIHLRIKVSWKPGCPFFCFNFRFDLYLAVWESKLVDGMEKGVLLTEKGEISETRW